MSENARFSRYVHAQTATRAAVAEYNSASRLLELARVQERSAELASQSFESGAGGRLAETLGTITDREREIGLAFVRYAVHSRFDKAC